MEVCSVLLNGGTMDAMAECMVDFFANRRIPPSAIDNIGYVVSHPILGIECILSFLPKR